MVVRAVSAEACWEKIMCASLEVGLFPGVVTVDALPALVFYEWSLLEG